MQPNTAIFPHPYKTHDAEDTFLGPNGELRGYLEGLIDVESVPTYVKEHPFGQPAITPWHPDWNYYAKVVREFSKEEDKNDSRGRAFGDGFGNYYSGFDPPPYRSMGSSLGGEFGGRHCNFASSEYGYRGDGYSGRFGSYGSGYGRGYGYDSGPGAGYDSGPGGRFVDYGGYGGPGEFGGRYCNFASSEYGYRGDGYSGRFGSCGGGYSSGYGRGAGYDSGPGAGYDSGRGAGYGSRGLYGSRAGYSGSSRYHPYGR